MASLPYMQLFVADYLADTAHLSTTEHGAYLLLIMNYWQRGKPLYAANERLASVARMSNEEWNKIQPTIAEFFEEKDGVWVHHRIERDLAAVRDKSDKAKAAGKASAERRLNKRSTNVQRTFNHKDTDTDIKTNKKPCSKKVFERSFNESFWPHYPKKVGKKPALKAWLKLEPSSELVGIIVKSLNRQHASPQWIKDDGKYIPNPSTWLNGERWNDELTMAEHDRDPEMDELYAKAKESADRWNDAQGKTADSR